MVEHVGVAVVPGSSFYSQPELGRHVVRFSFCKRMETLRRAGERMRTRLDPPS
jgi:aminotransferase